MIVETMNPQEVYQEVLKDKKEVTDYGHRSALRFFKKFLKHKLRDHVSRTTSYTSRRRNNYYLIFEADQDGCSYVVVNYHRNGKGLIFLHVSADDNLPERERPEFVFKHVFDRYAQRVLKEDGIELRDAITKFYINNLPFVICKKREIGNGVSEVLSLTKEGALLGIQGSETIYKTFISQGQLRRDQRMTKQELEKAINERVKEDYGPMTANAKMSMEMLFYLSCLKAEVLENSD